MPKEESSMPKVLKTNVQLFVWDITLFWDGDDRPSVADFRRHLSAHCKKYAFQLERAPTTGRLHYQCRVSLKEKLRKHELKARFCVGPYANAKLGRTTNECKGDEFYVTKESSRVEGPWTDRDPPTLRTVEKMVTLYPWQESLKNLLIPYDQRSVHVLVDTIGNHGKTSFQKYMCVNHKATWIPPMYDMKDIMQFVMSLPIAPIYIINMPRAMNKTALGQFYAGVEQLKDGMLYDTRYHGKQMLIDEPNVLVLTNELPEMGFLSMDRWNVWKIVQNVLCNYAQ